MAAKSKPGAIHIRIIEAMKRFPDGLSGGQIRAELEKEGLTAEEQTHLDRRKRDLPKWFVIEKKTATLLTNGKQRRVMLYRYIRDREQIEDQGQPSKKLRSQVIHAAHGRCQMCGRTVEKHGIALVVDHKKPRDWGGTNDRDNLWAICEDCNAGKKAYFSSVQTEASADLMKRVMSEESVHVRIGETLKAFGIGKPVPDSILEVVADQEDWHKRLRELRYPVIGWEIGMKRYKNDAGRITVDYVLESYKDWPPDPTGAIRKFEQEREKQNRLRAAKAGARD